MGHLQSQNFQDRKRKGLLLMVLTVGFEPTPFRTRTLIWRLRPTRPYQLDSYSWIK